MACIWGETRPRKPLFELFQLAPFASRALPTETKVESGTSRGKSGTSGNSSNSGLLVRVHSAWFEPRGSKAYCRVLQGYLSPENPPPPRNNVWP